jgi:hypothetical protein
MALHGIEAVLFLVLFHLSLLVAQASGLWYLLVPPADYSTATHRYTSLADAPLGRWYHKGSTVRSGSVGTREEPREMKRNG